LTDLSFHLPWGGSRPRELPKRRRSNLCGIAALPSAFTTKEVKASRGSTDYLNDDLTKHPFDEELKQIAHAFAVLVKPMIERIDRHGLKSRFLRKHLPAVGCFAETARFAQVCASIQGRVVICSCGPVTAPLDSRPVARLAQW
jgi:hypothetical protein